MRCRFPVWETGPYDYLLDIIANVLRAFLRKENVPENETETLVSKVKEKKIENGITETIKMLKDCGVTKEFIIDRICKAFHLSTEEAKEKVDLYWED